jgi:hypothetical protein
MSSSGRHVSRKLHDYDYNHHFTVVEEQCLSICFLCYRGRVPSNQSVGGGIVVMGDPVAQRLVVSNDTINANDAMPMQAIL